LVTSETNDYLSERLAEVKKEKSEDQKEFKRLPKKVQEYEFNDSWINEYDGTQ